MNSQECNFTVLVPLVICKIETYRREAKYATAFLLGVPSETAFTPCRYSDKGYHYDVTRLQVKSRDIHG